MLSQLCPIWQGVFLSYALSEIIWKGTILNMVNWDTNNRIYFSLYIENELSANGDFYVDL